MSIYIWLAIMGLVGLSALGSFIYSLIRDIKFIKKLSLSNWNLMPNWLLILISASSISMMVFFFFSVKDQITQYG